MSGTLFESKVAIGMRVLFGLFALLVATAGQAAGLGAQTSHEGMVTVTVKPLDLSGQAGSWRFEVELNTHVSPVTQDMAAVSVLADDRGEQFRPIAWQGDPPGGHHRKGVLEFRPIKPTPRSVTLTIREVGGVAARTFTWLVPAS